MLLLHRDSFNRPVLRSPYISGDLGQSMREDVAIFFDRAKKFEIASEHFFKEGIYDLATFHIGQSLQLYLKYILAKEVGLLSKDSQPIETF